MIQSLVLSLLEVALNLILGLVLNSRKMLLKLIMGLVLINLKVSRLIAHTLMLRFLLQTMFKAQSRASIAMVLI